MIRTGRKYTERELGTTEIKGQVRRDKEDDYLKCAEYEGRPVNDTANNVALFKHDNGQFYFVLYKADGGVRLRSEGFATANDRDQELSGVLKYKDDESLYSKIEVGNYYMDVLKDKTGREVGRSCAMKIAATATTTTATTATATTASTATATATGSVEVDPIFGLKSDNLQIVEGIGPKINELLSAAGIVTWRQLSQATPERLKVENIN